MFSHTTPFLKALTVSLLSLGTPALIYNYYPLTKSKKEKKEEMREEVKVTPEEESNTLKEETKPNETNQFCPKDNSNSQYCSLLTEIIETFDGEIGDDFSKKIFLQHPIKNVKIPLRESLTRTDEDSLEIFNYYFTIQPNSRVESGKSYMEALNDLMKGKGGGGVWRYSINFAPKKSDNNNN